ncbi:general secretion pathway protein GspN [Vibrio neptunius]|uniref:type II secretion system protein N n=1 Tax=Vibrio neptunius TaxID=170651 RepID=UPI0005FA3A6A|nr:type II secretion system protein N [Vibrio neptunius]KJY82588.1 general secretion pathway protein GspN [Vibrio neptunius]
MKKVILLSLTLVMVFLISAVAHVPAQVALNYLPLPPQLVVHGVSGTIWDGSATGLTWQRQKLGALNWQLAPLKLLVGKAEAQVRFGRGSDMQLTGRGVVGYSMSGPYAENLIASLPVAKILELAPPIPVPVELTGQVELSIHSMVYVAPYCQTGEGSVVWNADKVITPLDELNVGPVVVNFSCQDSQISLKGDQNSQQVNSAAEVMIQANRSYQASAWFKPSDEFPSSLAEQLKWLPSPDSEGRYQFTYHGRL